MPAKKTARKAKRKSPVAASGKPARRRTRLHKADPPQTPPAAVPVKAASLVSPAGGADPEAFIAASPHKLPLSSLPAAHSEAGFAVVAEGVPNPTVIANVSKRTKVRQAKSTAVVSPLTAGQVPTKCC